MQLGGHRQGRTRREAAGRSHAPLHARRRCATRLDDYRRVHAVSRPAAVPHAARRPEGERATSSGSPGTRRSTRSPTRLSRRHPRATARQAIWPYLRLGQHGHSSRASTARAAGSGTSLGASPPPHDDLHDRGWVGHRLHPRRQPRRHGSRRPSASPSSIILWGSNTLTTNHHLWRSITTARRNGAHLVVIDPIRTRTADLGGQPPGRSSRARTPRWPSDSLHVVLREGGEDRDFIDASHPRLGRVPPAHPGLPAGTRRRDLPVCPVEAIVELGKRIAHTRPDGHPGDHGTPAARRRRNGRADHHLHPGRHRRLALSRAVALATTPAASSA